MLNVRKFQWTILFTLCCLLALCLAGFSLAVPADIGASPAASTPTGTAV